MDGITSPKCDTHVSNLFVLYYAEILTIFFKENKNKNNNIWKMYPDFFTSKFKVISLKIQNLQHFSLKLKYFKTLKSEFNFGCKYNILLQ